MQNTNTVDTKTSGCACQAESRLSIAECLDTILEYVSSDDLPINDGDGKGGLPEKEYDYVCGRLDISRKQAEIFAAIVELSLSGNASATIGRISSTATRLYMNSTNSCTTIRSAFS